MTFSDIALLSEELRILRSLKRHGARALTKKEQDYTGALLTRYHFIQSEQDLYSITKEGRRYLNFYSEDNFRHRWPVYLAIVSAVFSGISLLIAVKSLIMTINAC